MRRDVNTRLARLAQSRPDPAEPLCVHHGAACAMGTQELPELYRMVIEAKAAQGMPVPPLNEHRAMTREERRHHEREVEELIAAQKARNEAALAELTADRDVTTNHLEES